MAKRQIVVQQIIVRKHQLGEKMVFSSYIDFDRFLGRGHGYSRRCVNRGNLVVCSRAGLQRQYFVVQQVNRQTLDPSASLEDFFERHSQHYGIYKGTDDHVLHFDPKKPSKMEQAVKKEQRRQIRKLLLIIDSRYSDLTEAERQGSKAFRELQWFLGVSTWPKKAWFVKSKSHPQASKGLVWAETRGQAKYQAISSDSVFCNFGKYHLDYTDIIAKRIPELDGNAFTLPIKLLSDFFAHYDYDTDNGKALSDNCQQLKLF